MKKLAINYFAPSLVFGGFVAAIVFINPPIFDKIDNFVLFAQEEIKLEQDVQVSSGDIGSNNKINVEKTVINGNLFADEIELDKNVVINGSVSSNKLEIKKETQMKLF